MFRTLFSVIAVVLLAAMAVLVYTNNVGSVKSTVDNAITGGGMPPPQPAPLPAPQPAPEPVPAPVPAPAPMPVPQPVVHPIPAPPPAEPKVVQQPERRTRRTHVVQPGDTLSSISRTYFGTPDYYEKIAAANNLRSKDHIRVRQVLVLPDLPIVAEAEAVEEPREEPRVEVGSQDFVPQPPTLNITVPRK